MKRRYTATEDAVLTTMFPTTRIKFIAMTIGRSYASVHQRIKYLGLKRTAKQKSAIYSGWSRQPKHRTSLSDEHRL